MAPNDYYTEQFSGFDGGRASARQIEQMGRNVQAGFDKLPGEREIKENRVNYAEATVNPVNTAYAVVLPYPIAGYVDGLFIAAKMPSANAGAATINVDGRGGKEIRDIQGVALQPNQWVANAIVGLRYTDEGTGHFILQGGGIRGGRGTEGLRGAPYRIASATAMANPGDGLIRLNNASPDQATAIAIADLDGDGADLSSYIATWDDFGEADSRGYLILRRPDSADALVFLVESVTDATGWTQLAVSHVAGTSAPSTSDTYGVQFAAIGKTGLAGYTAGLPYRFATATGAADPGQGRMRFNNAALASVDRIYIDDRDADGNDVGDWIDEWEEFDKTRLIVRGTASSPETVVFAVSGVTDRTGYREVAVRHIAGTRRPANNALVNVQPLLAGEAREIGTLTDAATIVWDLDRHPVAQVTLPAARALRIVNGVEGRSYGLWVMQGGSGNHALTLPTGAQTPPNERVDLGALSGSVDLTLNDITFLGFSKVFGKLRLLAQRGDYR
ncbi:MAG: hypothetical protein F4Y02_13005 [Chloroflexi bacterium]|nr:hypothetical protein [Chloroflexota bacterium]